MNIREANTNDIPAIQAMADVVFRKTYADILSPEQMEYMMNWMYSEESLRGQIEGEGDFHIGNGFYMNDFIYGMDIE